MEYDKSKMAGNIIEDEVLRIIQQKFPESHTTEKWGKFSDYDIYIPELDDGIEVKGDYKSAETGNIVVEVEMNGSLSALSVTKALYWVFIEGYRLIWLKPLDIYRFIEQNELARVSFIGKGDTAAKFAYLINHEKLVLFAHKYGKVQMIPEDSPIYYNNFTKRIDLINDNKTISV